MIIQTSKIKLNTLSLVYSVMELEEVVLNDNR